MQQNGNRGSIPQHNKGHIWGTNSQHHTQWAKTRMSAFSTPIQHSTGSPSHSNQIRKRNKGHPDWKGESKTVIVCRWHDSVHKKSYRLHQKTTQPSKWIWQNSRIQSQYSEEKWENWSKSVYFSWQVAIQWVMKSD